MNITYQIKKWDDTSPVLLTILRVILGLCITAKGIYFANHNDVLAGMLTASKLNALSMNGILAFIITWINLLGGIFIILGLFLRFFLYVQVPIVIGAILFVNMQTGISSGELLFSIFILLLLALFIIKGPGHITMDYYNKKGLIL